MSWIRSPYITLDPAGPRPSSAKDPEPETDIFADHARKAWGTGTEPEPRCDFAPSRTALTAIAGGARVATIWRRSVYGQTLSEIKASGNILSFIIPRVTEFLLSIIGPCPSPEAFVIVSPPKRRHPGRENFASRICAEVARLTGLGYIDDFAVCRTRARIDPEFHIAAPLPHQPSVIVIDDILTTGSTLTAMHRLLVSAGKSPILIAAILNRK